MWLKVVLLVLQAVIFWLAKVILNKSLTRRQANITAERQYHSSLDEYHKSVRIYLVVAIPYGKSDNAAVFYVCKGAIKYCKREKWLYNAVKKMYNE